MLGKEGVAGFATKKDKNSLKKLNLRNCGSLS